MQDEEIRNFLIEAGFQPIYKDSKDFAKTVQDATDRLEYLINEVGVEFVDD
jgi:tripartite-type tricarboxylate transporter receptor subunit TctC